MSELQKNIESAFKIDQRIASLETRVKFLTLYLQLQYFFFILLFLKVWFW